MWFTECSCIFYLWLYIFIYFPQRLTAPTGGQTFTKLVKLFYNNNLKPKNYNSSSSQNPCFPYYLEVVILNLNNFCFKLILTTFKTTLCKVYSILYKLYNYNYNYTITALQFFRLFPPLAFSTTMKPILIQCFRLNLAPVSACLGNQSSIEA